jgi:hypothetical protein
LSAAVAGDIIQCLPGALSITAQIVATLPADVTLRGAGWNGVDGGGDATVITDNFTTNNYGISITTPGRFRMTGFTFQGGTGTFKDNGFLGLFASGGGTAQVRLDHQHWTMNTGNWSNMKLMSVGAGIRGVLDSSILDMKELSWIHIVNGRSQGDTEWAQDTNFGSNDFFYIEDNQINGSTTGTVYSSIVLDSHTGGKFVIRFNTLVECGVSQTHPTGHAADDRGCRAHENYCNVVTSSLAKDPNFAMDYNNSGGAMVWGNSANNVFKNMLYLNNCRAGPGGSNCGYTQSAPPNGWGYPGTTYGPSNWDSNVDSSGYRAIDQPGSGRGDLLSGTFPSKTNTTTGTVAWPNQALEPIYYWNNAGSIVSGWGGSYMANLAGALLVTNRDYYETASAVQSNPTTPFNGTTGCGWGTLANRPSSGLTVGVGYFATDVGSWNSSVSNPYGVNMAGASGLLYVATSATTWALAYTPYTYPHPLRTQP